MAAKTILKYIVILFFASADLIGACKSCLPCTQSALATPSNAWQYLQSSNQTFVNDCAYGCQRAGLVPEQNPFSVVLSCADSRVSPELVFNQGLGKLFVSRVAGPVVDNVVVDSIEYAVGHYDVKIIVVMGHTNCGAVTGALARLRKNKGKIAIKSGHLDAVLMPIEKAIKKAGIDIYASNALALSIRANVRYVADNLVAESKVIQKALATGILTIVGAEYSLETGKVAQLFVIK